MGNETDEILRIDNFAGTREAEIHIEPFTVLVGPPDSGTSTCAKLAYFSKRLPNLISNLGDGTDGKSLITQQFLKYFSTIDSMAGSCSVQFLADGEAISIKRHLEIPEDVDIAYPSRFDGIIHNSQELMRLYGSTDRSDKGPGRQRIPKRLRHGQDGCIIRKPHKATS